MRLPVDDEIYRVDAVWLGPPQQTLPWRARYSAYGVGLAIPFLLCAALAVPGMLLLLKVAPWNEIQKNEQS